MSLRNFLYNYPIISIIIVLWVLAIVTFATVKVFLLAKVVDAALASCYAALLGLPAVGFGVFQWRMGQKKDGDS